MKKAIAIICIIFGGILLIAGLSIVELLLWIEAFPIGGVLALALLVGAAVLLDRFRGKLKREYDIHSAVFVCCSTLPALVLDAARYLVFNQVGGTDSWDILAFLFILAEAITAPILLVLLLIVMLIAHLMKKYRGKRSSPTENKEEV